MTTYSQLWHQCQSLTHASLQAFLLSILERPNIYHYHQFLKHPQIATVDKKVLEIFEVFANKCWKDLSQQFRKQLSQEKSKKLKQLTILSLFQGLKQTSLRAIQTSIQCTRQQIIDLLIQMSIAGMIQVKINEQTQTIEIHYAEIRSHAYTQENTKMLEAKVTNIISKNNQVLQIIDEAYSEMRNKKDEKKWH